MVKKGGVGLIMKIKNGRHSCEVEKKTEKKLGHNRRHYNREHYRSMVKYGGSPWCVWEWKQAVMRATQNYMR